MRTINQDIKALKTIYQNMPTIWNGKKCILELKEANFQWKQMEWIGFYFEFISNKLLQNDFEISGDKFGNVKFDLKGAIIGDIEQHKISFGEK